VKTVFYQSLTCYNFKAQATQQLMGELPSTRVQISRQFLTTGVDNAVTISRSKGPPRSEIITKVYISMLVCFVTKNVHIEIFTSFPTDVYLAALRRLIARRVKPWIICSENIINFQAAANEIHVFHKMLQSKSQMAALEISWPLKVAIGNSFHHMDLTSKDYRKQM